MRNETAYLCGLEPEPANPDRAAVQGCKDHLSTGQARRRGLYAVEVCWISGDAVTCRTYQVCTTNEVRAARLACQRAGKDLGARVGRIEAVDVEDLQRGSGHE